MLMFDVVEQEKKKTIVLKGDLTIEHAIEIRKVLSDILEASEECVVDVSGAESVDLSCLQLMCSAHRHAVGHRLKISLSSQWSEQFDTCSKEAGFVRNGACRLNSGSDCLWAQGGKQDG